MKFDLKAARLTYQEQVEIADKFYGAVSLAAKTGGDKMVDHIVAYAEALRAHWHSFERGKVPGGDHYWIAERAAALSELVGGIRAAQEGDR